MVKYLQKVKNQLHKFSEWKVTQITREKNIQVDALVGLAVSSVVSRK